ncbi:MAG TPA: CoA transferase, partial [Burkholderiales bacterium]|nr:CoA transferase [Burkholderiales bacterium]
NEKIMPGPLSDVRIVDLTAVVLGPYATQILADLGAEVIKIEPREGDILRHAAPMKHSGMGHIFLHHNRNKRSIVLDLKKPAGREVVLRLVRNADVFIHNTRPQAMARLKLAYNDVRDVNPQIIYVGAFGYGQKGRYAAKPAYDDLIQGMSALPWLYAKAGGGTPRFVPTAIADRITGLATVNAVTSALYCRERTGIGQAVDVPMFETLTQLMLSDHMAGYTFDPPVMPAEYGRMVAPHRAPYATSDGYICLLIYNDKQWRAFFRLIGREEMFEGDPRFSNQEMRSRNIAEVYAFVARHIATRTSAEWLKALDDADIPVTPLMSLDDLRNDPHLHDSGFYTTVEHPTEGRLRAMRSPDTWSRTEPDIRRHAPRLGEHSIEVLTEAGYGEDEIQRMLADGVTAVPPSAKDEG